MDEIVDQSTSSEGFALFSASSTNTSALVRVRLNGDSKVILLVVHARAEETMSKVDITVEAGDSQSDGGQSSLCSL